MTTRGYCDLWSRSKDCANTAKPGKYFSLVKSVAQHFFPVFVDEPVCYHTSSGRTSKDGQKNIRIELQWYMRKPEA